MEVPEDIAFDCFSLFCSNLELSCFVLDFEELLSCCIGQELAEKKKQNENGAFWLHLKKHALFGEDCPVLHIVVHSLHSRLVTVRTEDGKSTFAYLT